MIINYTSINSSNIDGYFYSKEEKRLYIKFVIQREYYYDDVSEEEMKSLLEADSFGKELRSKIMPNKKSTEITKAEW